MKIVNAEKETSYIVDVIENIETGKITRYRRTGPNNWQWLVGSDSIQLHNSCEILEDTFIKHQEEKHNNILTNLHKADG